jgi:hypothetical protein
MLALGRLVARELGVPGREPAASLAPALPPSFDASMPREAATLEEAPAPRRAAFASASPRGRLEAVDAVGPPPAPTRTVPPAPATPPPRAPRAIDGHDDGATAERPARSPGAQREAPRHAPAPAAPLRPPIERAAERAVSLTPVAPPIDRPAAPRRLGESSAAEPSPTARVDPAPAAPVPRVDSDAHALRPMLPPTPPLAATRAEASAPPVQITIGRLEIRASRETPAATPPRAAAEHAAPSLASYLRRRSNGDRS